MQGYLKKFGDNEQIETEISSLFFRLSKNLEKKSLLFWHVQSFQDYIKSNINPLGLRIQIFPTMEDLDTDFKLKWENILSTCSRNLMEALIEEYTKRTKMLDMEITKICKCLQQFKTLKSAINKEQKLKIHLEAFNNDILVKKGQKFLRDKNAFEVGKAYKWNQNKITTRNTNMAQNSHFQRSPPYTTSSTNSKSKSTVGTKRQFQSDSTSDHKPKKTNL